MDTSANVQSITVNQAPIAWNHETGIVTFFGIEAVLFWQKPSLISILQPLIHEIGESLYAALVAYESSKGTYEDYNAIVTTMGKDFEEGFLHWGQVVTAAGWGKVSFASPIDWEKKEATVRIVNSWEQNTFTPRLQRDYTPFLAGKLSGIFSYAFSTNVRAHVQEVGGQEDERYVILHLAPSSTTLEEELRHRQYEGGVRSEEQLKLSNAALHQSMQRFSDVVEALGEYVWEMDKYGTLLYVSGKVFDVFGFFPSEMIGKSIHDFTDETYREMTQAFFQKQAEAKASIHNFEYAMCRKDGRRVWVKITGVPIRDIKGEVTGYRGAGLNITERKKAEAEIKEKEEMMLMQSRQAAMGEMIGMIAHQWRQPITGIGMAVNNILLDIDLDQTLDPVQLRKKLTGINDQVLFLSKTIDDFRNFFKSNKKREICQISEIIDQALQITGISLKNDDIEIKKEFSSLHDVSIFRNELLQVFLNILKNTQDAFREKKQAITHKIISITTLTEAEGISIQFTDNAGGIPEDTLQHIFEPYFSTKPEKTGTGLGLYMSKIIIEKHHHGILAARNVDQGACFDLFIPNMKEDS